MDSKKRTLRRLGLAGIATAMTTLGVPALAGAATVAHGSASAGPSTSATVPGVPSAPTALAATAGPAQISLTWKAPSNSGDSKVIGYNVYVGTASGAEQGPVNFGVLVTGTSYTVTGLTNGTKYYVVVTAVNSQGESTVSNEASATPVATVPAAPTAVSATAGYQEATVNWTVPANGGATITSFIITPTSGTTSLSPITVPAGAVGSATDPTPGASDSFTVTGLTNGTAYTFTVAAANSQGTGPASASTNSVTPAVGVPDAPTNVAGTYSSATGSITLTWSAPANNGGSTILGYNVYEGTAPGKESATPLNGASLVNSPYTVTPVKPGTTYYFTVKAVNAQGSSAASTESAGVVVPALVTPAAPSGVSATAGYQSAVVNWTVPADPGTAIASFLITANNITTNTTSTYTVTAGAVGSSTDPTPGAKDSVVVPAGTTTPAAALINGDAYTFTVAATNTGTSGGTGPASAASNTVVPNPTAPAPVTNLQATSTANTTLNLTWTASASSGDANAVAGYNIYEGTSTTPLNAALVTGTSYAATGLVQGSAYTFTVKAVNSTGVQSTGVSLTATAGNATPSAPTGLSASGGNTTIALSWTPSTYEGTGTGATYTVLNGTTVVASGLTGDTYTVSGLINGTPYTYTVEAVSSANVTSINNPSVTATPATVPGAPGKPTATGVSTTSVNVEWTAPTSTGGSPITGYTVTATDTTTAANGGQTCTTTGATSCTVTGLTTGDTYTFSVVATNAQGSSSASLASNSVTAGPVAPGAPTGVTAAANGTNVTVKWTAPKSDGGSPILGYNIYVSTNPTSIANGFPVNGDILVTGTSAVLDGNYANIFPGQHYYLSVQAVSTGVTTPIPGPASTPIQFATSFPIIPGTPTIAATTLHGPGYTVISGVTAPNATVVLYDSPFGSTSFFKKAVGLSNATGGYSFRVHILRTNRFYVVVDGQQSAIVTAKVLAAPTRIYITPPARRLKPGIETIRVTTNKPGSKVTLHWQGRTKTQVSARQANGNGVTIFRVLVTHTTKVFAVDNGVRSNTVTVKVLHP